MVPQGKPPKPPLILEHILSQNINMAKGFSFWWYLEPTSPHSKMGVGGETFLNINLCVRILVSYHFVCTLYKPSVALLAISPAATQALGWSNRCSYS